MSQYLFYAYVTAIGFCAAGVCSSFSQLVTGQPMHFDTAGRGPRLVAVFGVLARVIAGPAIVMRNAITAALRGRPPFWLALSTVLSAFWSFLSGVVLLEAVIRLAS